jgi:radical SAM/Cys-rich protein
MKITLQPTLQRQGHALAPAAAQRRLLTAHAAESFAAALTRHGLSPLRAAERPRVLQINVGRRCNQTCSHCHVDAGPERREVMADEIVEACLRVLQEWQIPTLDITGGAPELHPRFDEIVRRARAAGAQVIDRCNLTITQLPNYRYLPQFLAEQQVEIIASLPDVDGALTDEQRGHGVFAESIAALQEFSALGYGRPGSGLVLNLIANPAGTQLPQAQDVLEARWRPLLAERYGIHFNAVYTLTNQPISRFLVQLANERRLSDYLELLRTAFNPATVSGLQCRDTLSVGWDGRLFDCDFNQMLELALPQRIDGVTQAELAGRLIRTLPHCYACTAAAGST